MSETFLISLIGIAGTVLSSSVSYFLGTRREKKKQSLIIKSKMLEPIENWLVGAEKMIGIFYDTIVTLSQGLPLPMTYNLEERRIATKFMIENTNKTLGVLDSKELQTRNTKVLSVQLSNILKDLDNRVKYELLPEDNKLVEFTNRQQLNEEFIKEALNLRQQLDRNIQAAYSIIAKIKTKLT